MIFKCDSSAMSKKNLFWISYSDMMTSLFLIMLTLFVVFTIKMVSVNAQLRKNNQELIIMSQSEDSLKIALQSAVKEANATNEQLKTILQLDEQFVELANSTALRYDEQKKMFVSPSFEGIEIFEPDKDNIKPDFLLRVDEVGNSLQLILARLHTANPNFSYQLVIEGTAAIPWKQLRAKTYNPDNQEMYLLSYKRALALYQRWRKNGLNLRQYNTEIVIAGSGFNGINRDYTIEENNKRFIIQIIPKIKKPQTNKSSMTLKENMFD